MVSSGGRAAGAAPARHPRPTMEWIVGAAALAGGLAYVLVAAHRGHLAGAFFVFDERPGALAVVALACGVMALAGLIKGCHGFGVRPVVVPALAPVIGT